jgi:hypothetical protein
MKPGSRPAFLFRSAENRDENTRKERARGSYIGPFRHSMFPFDTWQPPKPFSFRTKSATPGPYLEPLLCASKATSSYPIYFSFPEYPDCGDYAAVIA